MDIYELRSCINVYNFGRHDEGASIFYTMNKRNRSFVLDNETLLKELIIIGSLEDTIYDEQQFQGYILSQWDALNIAIRFELTREQEKDIDNSDIFKAIANIIKPTNE